MYYRPSTAEQPSALLVLCHPSEDASLCRNLADIWQTKLGAAGVKVFREDLGRSHLGLEGAGALGAALTGRDPDNVVSSETLRWQELVEACQFLIFVHPIFWFEVPSQLKGFQESVLSSGFAFRKLPGHWLLNRAVGVASRVPLLPRVMRRYAAYGLLRDKRVFVTRTMGGPEVGLSIFDHGATSLESSLQFCGARINAVDTIAEIDDTSADALKCKVLPKFEALIHSHCCDIAKLSSTSAVKANGVTKDII